MGSAPGPDVSRAVPYAAGGNREVRTMPPWAHTVNEDDEDLEFGAIQSPPSAHLAQHSSRLAPKHKQKAEPGRLWDHLRDAQPYIQRRPFSEDAAMWREYIKSTRNPMSENLPSVRVTHEWLEQHGPDYSQPWLAGRGDQTMDNDAAHLFKHHKHTKTRWQRMQRIILRNAIIPLAIRAIVLFFSTAAMGIAASLLGHVELKGSSSLMMALIVDIVAVVYLVGITFDEYTSKPLGLRSATAKMRLIFLDLFFIVCDSANLSLAFQAVAHEDPTCTFYNTLTALAMMLLIALISWVLTFGISVLRVIERVSG